MSGILDKNGSTSSTRLNMFITTFTGCGVAFLGVWKGVDLIGLGVLVTGILATGAGAKVYQSKGEL
jgi:hypothetical protein